MCLRRRVSTGEVGANWGSQALGMRPSPGRAGGAGSGFSAKGTGQQDFEQSTLWSDLLGVGTEAERTEQLRGRVH